MYREVLKKGYGATEDFGDGECFWGLVCVFRVPARFWCIKCRGCSLVVLELVNILDALGIVVISGSRFFICRFAHLKIDRFLSCWLIV